ncbi:hypothetical protein ANN_15104 [Periplaneta americana]|uniref:Uncharacterized protein n=1 Tax=Periplaneta americana TaxID=6978 RepID=A0ABQ8SZQ6_PERAM|nr:hypothetical protein ANN_15104 [Periplaneta americana]
MPCPSQTDRISNESLSQMASTTNFTQRANKLKWKWGGHIARMKDERWTYRATMWDPRTGDRHRGRPRKRWADFYTTQAAHALHGVAEQVRNQFPEVDQLIGCVKKIFLKAPSQVANFKDNYGVDVDTRLDGEASGNLRIYKQRYPGSFRPRSVHGGRQHARTLWSTDLLNNLQPARVLRLVLWALSHQSIWRVLREYIHPISPDLTPFDFFFWDSMVYVIYVTPVATTAQLNDRINAVFVVKQNHATLNTVEQLLLRRDHVDRSIASREDDVPAGDPVQLAVAHILNQGDVARAIQNMMQEQAARILKEVEERAQATLRHVTDRQPEAGGASKEEEEAPRVEVRPAALGGSSRPTATAGGELVDAFDPDDCECNVNKIDQLGCICDWSDYERAYFMQAKLRGGAKAWYNHLDDYDLS